MARRGNCYVTCEALYHLLGKPRSITPHYVKHEGTTHWFLVQKVWTPDKGRSITWVIDPTAKQFKTPPDYFKGTGCGFLTKKPSKRAKSLMEIMLWQG